MGTSRERLAFVLFATVGAVAGCLWWARSAGESPIGPPSAPPPTDGRAAPTLSSAPPAATPAPKPERPAAMTSDTPPPTDGVGIHGRVTDGPAGAPITDATIQAFISGNWKDMPSTRTASDGEFTLPPISSSAEVTLIAKATGRMPVERTLGVGAPRDAVEIVLLPGGVLEGFVRDPEGQPLAGRTVFVAESDDPLPPRRAPTQWWVGDEQVGLARARLPTATTDERGHFEISGVPLHAAVSAVVTASERIEARSEPATFEIAGAHERRDVSFATPGSVLVRLPARPRREDPVQVDLFGETVWYSAQKEDRREDGSCLFKEVAPGRYHVKTFPHDAPWQDIAVEVRAGQRTEVDATPPPGGAIEGLVTDDQGRPIAGVDVGWSSPEGHGVMGETDASGRFRFGSLPPGTGTIEVQPDEGGWSPVTLHDVRVGGEPVRIVLRQAPVVVGRITGFAPGKAPRLGLVSPNFTGGESDLLGPDGRFRMRMYETETPALIVAVRSEGAPTLIDVPPLAAGSRRDVGDVALDPGRTLAGIVVDETGRPRAGAIVSVVDRWAEFVSRTRETAADGTFRFEAMPSRSIELRVDLEGHPVHIETVPITAASPVRLVADLGGGLSIRVVDESGAPAPASVSFAPDGEHPYDFNYDFSRRGRDTDASGKLEVRLQARGHLVTAYDTRGRSARVASVVVEPGPDAKRLDLVLK